MADCRPKLIALALFWFVSFLATLTVYIVFRFALREQTCIVSGIGRIENCIIQPKQCRYIVDVFPGSVVIEGDPFPAKTDCFICEEETTQGFKQKFSKDKEVMCTFDDGRTDIRLIYTDPSNMEEKASLMAILSWVLLVVAICFALFFVVIVIRVFETELLRVCPPFVLTTWMNLHSVLRRSRTSSRASAPHGTAPEAFAAPPPAIASRRRISKLIEGSKLSAIEAKALREDGWSCCICLEERDDEEQLRPVARLKCNHATHSECLRLWLETGRAACCLCNAEVFSDGAKEQSLSSRASSTSGGDAGFIGSLVVERTDRTPSSPGTSVFIDVSQPYSDTAPSNDERDGDIESGV